MTTSPTDLARERVLKDVMGVEVIEQDPVFITESELVGNHWVDLLVSHLKGEEVPIDLWVRHVALNPFQEVSVINSKHEQKVLFVIPALFDRDKEIYPEDVSGNIAEIVNNVASKNNVIPNSGNGLLVDNLVHTVTAPKSGVNVARKWLPFLDYYEIKLEGVNAEDAVTAKSASVTLTVSNEDMDDDF